MPVCTFNFQDSHGRLRSRKLFNTQVAVADVITDIGTLAGLWNPLTDLGLVSVNIAFVDLSAAFALVANSNVDVNASVQVQGGDGYRYDFDLPGIPDSLVSGGALNTADTGVVDFFAEFATGDTWRINTRNPTFISQVLSGTLDR